MNEAEMVDVALGILIEVTTVLSPLTPMAGDSLWVGTSTGPLLLGREILPGCLRSHSFLLLSLLSQVSLSCCVWCVPHGGEPLRLAARLGCGCGCEGEQALWRSCADVYVKDTVHACVLGKAYPLGKRTPFQCTCP